MKKVDINLSKFLSLILRHKPEVIGIKLDENGWCDVQELLVKMSNKGKNITREDLDYIVNTDNKNRYTYDEDGMKIRANQGHSLNVNLELKKEKPPKYLYHGTIKKYAEVILQEGIKKGKRQYVHLSSNLETANIVGKRRGIPVVLKIEAGMMNLNGYEFYLSKNKVWLCDYIPSKYVSADNFKASLV